MQPKRDGVDEKENNVVKNLQRAIESVLTPSPSEPTLTALANAKNVEYVSRQKKAKFFKIFPFFA